jgi:hypothetical protein
VENDKAIPKQQYSNYVSAATDDAAIQDAA